MKTGFRIILIFIIIFFSTPCWFPVLASSPDTLIITGSVKQKLHLSTKDLDQFQPTEVQLNEVLRDGHFRGVFKYTGVSLKTLLEMAGIEKTNTDFTKPVDLAILVRNRQGQQAVLSWGEIFYKNPAHIIIASAAIPVIPHKKGKMAFFPNKKAYQQMMDTLNRDIGFPKLVVSGDLYTDRSLEDIVEIEVKDIHQNNEAGLSSEIYSEKFVVTGIVKTPLVYNKLPDFPRKTFTTHIVGEGRGYHGTKTVEGITFADILTDAEPNPGLNTVFMVSAPDGHRVLFSYGEIYLNPHGKRIIVSDTINSRPIEKFGKFILILPDDLMADRQVKAISRIDVISLK